MLKWKFHEECLQVHNSRVIRLEKISNITWARCGVASLVGATHCPCSKPSGGIDL